MGYTTINDIEWSIGVKQVPYRGLALRQQERPSFLQLAIPSYVARCSAAQRRELINTVLGLLMRRAPLLIQ